MPNRKLIYVAGPYTHPDCVENTNRAIRVAEKLIQKGYAVLIPHLSLLHHIVAPHPEDFWYQLTLAWMLRCDLVYRIEGMSKGADMEVAAAKAAGIPVIFEGSPEDPLNPNEEVYP